MIKLLYLARFREAFKRADEELLLPEPATVQGLLTVLRQRGQPFEKELASNKVFRIAVNHQMVSDDVPLNHGDEVAIFPPVTGG